MKAISLWQPWATLVAIGAKTIETRGWSTSYRGPIAIHAAKKLIPDFGSICHSEPFSSALEKAQYDEMGTYILDYLTTRKCGYCIWFRIGSC
jgi:hypothetical protein